MHIREVTINDVEAIQRINELSLGYPASLETTQKNMSVVLKKQNSKFLVMVDGEQVVGYIQAADYDTSYIGSTKNILALAVDVEHQGKGIGKQLLQAIEQWAKEDGCIGVRLVSSELRVEAHKFYEHCGYICRKLQKNFIKIWE